MDWMVRPPQVLQLGPTSISCKALIGWLLSGHQQSELCWIKLTEKPFKQWPSEDPLGYTGRPHLYVCVVNQSSFSYPPNTCIRLFVYLLNRAYHASLKCLVLCSCFLRNTQRQARALLVHKIPSAVCIHHKQTSCDTFSLRSALQLMLTDWAHVCHQELWAYLNNGLCVTWYSGLSLEESC